jgi:hypothetical protein
MQAVVELPDELGKLLVDDTRDLGRIALESIVLEGIRSNKLTTWQGREILCLGRYDMDGFLKRHDIDYEYSVEDFDQDARASWLVCPSVT